MDLVHKGLKHLPPPPPPTPSSSTPLIVDYVFTVPILVKKRGHWIAPLIIAPA